MMDAAVSREEETRQRTATLEWIPQSVRSRMDAAGVRISLAMWQAMALADRQLLAQNAGRASVSHATFVELLDAALARAGTARLAHPAAKH